jgi:uncharacterized protein (DUF2235 family)
MKRIVICCDGTWNSPDRKDGDAAAPSNVVKMARSIRPVDDQDVVQVVYYDEGVGSRGSRLSRMWAGMTGGGLEENVNDAYRFLIDNYAPGDHLYLFGFSRGAYTVRSLVGMIRKCGLLSKVHADRFLEAYWLYRNRDLSPDSDEACNFRDHFSIDPKIRVKVLGVWDTVGSLGIPWRPLAFTRKRHQFHDLRLSTFVENAFQALAVDEKRRQFPPAIWEVQAPSPRMPEAPLAPPEQAQRVEQVWFAGVHSNIGGGYRDTGLSDLSFMWMKERAASAGLAFDEDYLQAILRPNPFGVLRDSWTGFYRLTGSRARRICDPQLANPSESVDASVRKRWDGDHTYRPQNLGQHFERPGGIANP